MTPQLTVICALHSAGRSFSCLAALREALANLRLLQTSGEGAAITVYCIAPESLKERLTPLLAQFAELGGVARHWVPRDDATWYAAANRIVQQSLADAQGCAPANETPLLLLLHEDVELAPDNLAAMRSRLAQHDVCGVTPLMLTPPFASGRQYVLHLGTVGDKRLQVHHLYEGISAGHPLARADAPSPAHPERVFQTAPEAALLVRLHDFAAVGGFASGRPEEALQTLSQRLNRDAQREIGALTGWVEPGLMGFLALAVGLTLLSIMLPLLGVLGAV